MPDQKTMERVKGFRFHGVNFRSENGNQIIGDCPFCGKEDKFYVNHENLLWDCKRCGVKGNFHQFLDQVHKHNLETLQTEDLKKLAINRKLPLKAFNPWEIGLSELGFYTFPTRNEKGSIIDLRCFSPGQHIRGTASCATGLFGLHNLAKSKSTGPVYLCEGEWDGIAMSWLTSFLKIDCDVVAVPGANTFKREWISYFMGRDVYVCYDNDEAGESGELTVQERLTGTVKSLHYLHWIGKLPSGFDVRDYITYEAITLKQPRKAWTDLHKMFQSMPRKKRPGESLPASETLPPAQEIKDISLDELYTKFKKWLFLTDVTGIDVMLATIVSNELAGDPLWMFIVAPPGGAKTELLSSCNKCPKIYLTSSITPHALISGASWKGKDASLLPDLDGKTLIIKDFTTIISMKDTEKNEVFGIIRDAYDGSAGKIFGTGERRYYKSHFTILSGVTTAIYEVTKEFQSLGERFLKYTIGSNLDHEFEVDIIMKAIGNVNKELNMREELADAVHAFLHKCFERIKKSQTPTIPEDLQRKIASLAQFGARMRGHVGREKIRSEIITSKPAAEVGSRLGKQFAKMSIALAIVRSKSQVGEEEYTIVRKACLDTVSQTHEDIVHCLIQECPTVNDTLSTREIASKTRYTIATIGRILADMNMLGIVDRSGSSNKYQWTLSSYMRSLIDKAGLYTSRLEIERPRLRSLKVKIKKSARPSTKS